MSQSHPLRAVGVAVRRMDGVDVARALLAPILIVQGRRMFATMPRLAEPAGARAGTRGAGPPLKLLIVGDSSGVGIGAASQDDALLGRTVARLAEDRTVTYRLIARHGSTIPRTLRFLRKQPPETFDVAVAAIGVNDITAGTRLDRWMSSYRDLVDELQGRFGSRHVVASGLPPVGRFPAIPQPLRWMVGRQARRYDAALAGWVATRVDIDYIDFETAPGDPLHGVAIADVMAADGFHPGPKIYDEWGRRVADAVRRAVEA